MYNQVPVEAMTDSYKVGMSQLHSLSVFDKLVEILDSYSNFTPRKNAFMDFSKFSDGRLVVYGTRDTFDNVDKMFRNTFFNIPRSTVLKRIKRRIRNHFGSVDEHTKFLRDMGSLHDLGHLPIEVRAIDEGVRYPIGLPLFTVKNTAQGYGWLVNFIETLTSGLIWPMVNTATKVEQFYLQACHYGSISSPKEVFNSWLPIAVHEFGMRGYRGAQDQIRTSSASNLFFLGSDTMGVIDFFEDVYDADSDVDPIAVSVRATEHADISRMLSLFRHIAKDGGTLNLGGEEVDAQDVLDRTELYVLKWFVLNSTGILAYVSDTEDYYRLLNVYAAELKDLIRARKVREDGQPAKLTFRPDSSRHTPLNVICGYEIFTHMAAYITGNSVWYDSKYDDNIVVSSNGRYFLAKYKCMKIEGFEYVLGEEISKEEAEGSLVSLWNIFGGTTADTQVGKVKLLDPSVGLIYGEAISQKHQAEIYDRMIGMGFSTTNLIVGKGSYASLEGSTRDLFSMSYKQTFSTATVDGEYADLAQQKTPLGDVSKTSAKGLLKVVQDGNDFELLQEVSPKEEKEGALTLLYRNGVFFKKQSLNDIKNTYAKFA